MKRHDALLCLKSNVQSNHYTSVSSTPVASQFHPLGHVETEAGFVSSNVLVANQVASLILLWQDNSDTAFSPCTLMNTTHLIMVLVGIQYRPTWLVFLGLLQNWNQRKHFWIQWMIRFKNGILAKRIWWNWCQPTAPLTAAGALWTRLNGTVRFFSDTRVPRLVTRRRRTHWVKAVS